MTARVRSSSPGRRCAWMTTALPASAAHPPAPVLRSRRRGHRSVEARGVRGYLACATPTGSVCDYGAAVVGGGGQTAAMSSSYTAADSSRTPLAWVESMGGPLIVVPVSSLAAWRGCTQRGMLLLDGPDADDYDRACAVDALVTGSGFPDCGPLEGPCRPRHGGRGRPGRPGAAPGRRGPGRRTAITEGPGWRPAGSNPAGRQPCLVPGVQDGLKPALPQSRPHPVGPSRIEPLVEGRVRSA